MVAPVAAATLNLASEYCVPPILKLPSTPNVELSSVTPSTVRVEFKSVAPSTFNVVSKSTADSTLSVPPIVVLPLDAVTLNFTEGLLDPTLKFPSIPVVPSTSKLPSI